jgi:hypothetical protein
MLAAQMAAVHMASMTFAGRLAHVDDIPQQDSAARAFNKLTRTFAMQMEARTGAERNRAPRGRAGRASRMVALWDNSRARRPPRSPGCPRRLIDSTSCGPSVPSAESIFVGILPFRRHRQTIRGTQIDRGAYVHACFQTTSPPAIRAAHAPARVRRCIARQTVRPLAFKRPPLHVFWTYRRLTHTALPIHATGRVPMTFSASSNSRTAQGMKRTKMRVVGSKDKIEIAHHLAAPGHLTVHLTPPTHIAVPASKCLGDWSPLT